MFLRSISREVWTTLPGRPGDLQNLTLREGLCSLAPSQHDGGGLESPRPPGTAWQSADSWRVFVYWFKSSIFFIVVRFPRCNSPVVSVTSSINWSSSQFCLSMSWSADTWRESSDSSARCLLGSCTCAED